MDAHVIDVGANYGEMLVGAELPAGATAIAPSPNHRPPYLGARSGKRGLRVEIVPKAASARAGGCGRLDHRPHMVRPLGLAVCNGITRPSHRVVRSPYHR